MAGIWGDDPYGRMERGAKDLYSGSGGIGGFLANPVGNLIDWGFGLRDQDKPPAMSSYVAPVDPLAAAQEEEARRLEAIASGEMMDPSVAAMQKAFAQGGRLAYGAGQAAPHQSAAARGRAAIGGQAGAHREAGMLTGAQELQAQQAAQAGLLGIRQDQEAAEQARLEDEMNRRLEGEVRATEALEARRASTKGAMGEVAGVVTKLIPFSDERLKENIGPGQDQTREFLEALSPKSFDYKGTQQAFERDRAREMGVQQAFEAGQVAGAALPPPPPPPPQPLADKGVQQAFEAPLPPPPPPQQLGVMAQDLQQSQQGQQIVSPQPAYGGALALDPAQATGPMLAALGSLNERLNQIEGPQETGARQSFEREEGIAREGSPGMTTALASSAPAPVPLASSQMESVQIGALMKEKAKEEVMELFGGDMRAYDTWHKALPAADRSKIRNWGDAQALLEKGPQASFEPEGAPQGGGGYTSYKAPSTTDRKDMVGVVESVARAEGIDPSMLVAMGLMESGLDPSATPPKGTAKGMFQFIDTTWERQMELHGNRLGIPADAKPTDPVAATMMAVEFMRDNAKELKGKSGVPAEMGPPDYYAAHFFGAKGAEKLFKEMEKNPKTLAKDVFPAPAESNPTVFRHDKGKGAHKTLAEIYDYFKERTSKAGRWADSLLKSKSKKV